MQHLSWLHTDQTTLLDTVQSHLMGPPTVKPTSVGVRSQHAPCSPKRTKVKGFNTPQPFTPIPVALVHKLLLFGTTVHIILSQTSGTCTDLLCCSLWVCVSEIGSKTGKLSILHLRSTRSVCKGLINVNDSSSDASLCQRHLVRKFRLDCLNFHWCVGTLQLK